MSSGGQPLPPIDPNVKIPRGVLASSAKADEIHKAAYGTGEEPPPEGTQPPPPAVANPPQPTHPTPPPTPPAPATPPAAATPPAPAPVPTVPPATQDDWQHRYTSLKGRFDTLTGEAANMRSRLASLETMVATLTRTPPAATPPAATPPAPTTKRVSQKEIDEFSPELIDVIGRAALDVIEPVIAQRVDTLKSEFSKDFGKVDNRVKVAERSAVEGQHQRLLDFLDRQMPDWRTVNKHVKFHNWLDLTDAFSGVKRKALLDDAVRRGDSNRVLNFYSTFIAEQGVPPPANGQPPPPAAAGNQPPAANGNGRTTLESLAAPGRPAASGSGAPPPPEPPEIITRAQISKFYADKRRNVYSPEEAARLEAEIFKATNEGRIR